MLPTFMCRPYAINTILPTCHTNNNIVFSFARAPKIQINALYNINIHK